MEKAFAKVEELAENLKEYVNTKIESVKLSTAEKSSGIIANLIAGSILLIVLSLFIILVSIALSILIGIWIGKLWAGFLIIAFLYLIIGLIFWYSRASLIRLSIMNSITQQLFKNSHEEI